MGAGVGNWNAAAIAYLILTVNFFMLYTVNFRLLCQDMPDGMLSTDVGSRKKNALRYAFNRCQFKIYSTVCFQPMSVQNMLDGMLSTDVSSKKIAKQGAFNQSSVVCFQPRFLLHLCRGIQGGRICIRERDNERDHESSTHILTGIKSQVI